VDLTTSHYGVMMLGRSSPEVVKESIVKSSAVEPSYRNIGLAKRCGRILPDSVDAQSPMYSRLEIQELRERNGRFANIYQHCFFQKE
jgi:hypothetical protein